MTEGGKADRVGLKLGDSVVQINGQDTSEMSLQDAQKLIEISDSQLKLKVQKYKFLNLILPQFLVIRFSLQVSTMRK